MSASVSAAEMGSGISGSSSGMGNKTNGWASSKVIGLLGFGLTMVLFGLANLPNPYAKGFLIPGTVGIWTTIGMATIFGGAIVVLAGLIDLWRGHLYWGSAFLGLGAFWLAYTSTSGSLVTYFGGAAGTAPAYGMAAFWFVWMLFALTFLISSMKHGWMTFFLFLFLVVGFILLIIEFWQVGAANSISSGERWAVGGELVVTGLIAWYSATAELTNATYSKRLLPG